uniref:PAP2_C domain-containing protein n=1 Tax=Trichuris muris TaxID=70415 RepID=A0A5S6QMI9_TRIMR
MSKKGTTSKWKEKISKRRNDEASSAYGQQAEQQVAVRTLSNDKIDASLLELGKLALAFVILFMATMSNGLVMGYTHQYAVKYINKTEPLADSLFEVIPLVPWTWLAADVCTGATAIVSFLVLLFHRQRIVILRRAALVAAFLYCLRSITLLSTYLPPPFPSDPLRCLPAIDIKQEPTEYLTRAFLLVAKMGSSSDGKLILCGDTIFSGHTMVVVVSYWFLKHYCPDPLRPMALLIVLPLALLAIVCLIVSRQHYTVDVVVAIFLSVPILKVYHFWLREKSRRYVKGVAGILHPLHNLFVFFESNKEDGPVGNELCWPLPWPECLIAYFQGLNRIRLPSEQCV